MLLGCRNDGLRRIRCRSEGGRHIHDQDGVVGIIGEQCLECRNITSLISVAGYIDGIGLRPYRRQRGIELPYSCKGGVCSTCRAKLVEGEVDMDVNFALEDYEVARGFILCCQSYPVTDKVVVDFDQGA